MKFRIIKIGKIADPNYRQLVDKFEKRLRSFGKVEGIHIKAYPDDQKQMKELTARMDLSSTEARLTKPDEFLVSLDERGRILSSPELAELIQTKKGTGLIKHITFMIGGPYGLPSEVRKKSDFIWSLSKAVFPSDMAWMIVWEQLYRASSIIQGSSYHHE
ncbi:MAG: 23S rRNA (pseudouridine(1915)-N(3))-methyltransferase RlmH [Pseudobacteriovorax sp.]|nr:23S rRNA (pseudouridine(1915)-N(3))-methyltransferase RlmH [Pseudobacteriovorax sp.]